MAILWVTMASGKERASGQESRHTWLRALGSDDLPAQISLPDGEYHHARTYKHDFFAATGLYRGLSGLAVLKVGRTAPLFGLPMAWLGGILADHELAVYTAAEGIEGVPRCLGKWARTGLIHAFIDGHPLQRREHVNDAFFRRLEHLLDELHRRDIAYVDLEKRENILVDQHGQPALVDFQISWRWPRTGPREGIQRIIPGSLGRYILGRLQAADRYHLRKHQRRHRPDTLTSEQLAASYKTGALIAIHRWCSWPFTATRRMMLRVLTGRSRSPKQDGPAFLREAENGG